MRLTASELAELLAFYRLEPRGEWRDDLRVGHQTSILLGALGVKDNAKQPIKPADVTLSFSEKADEPLSVEATIAFAKGLVRELGGVIDLPDED